MRSGVFLATAALCLLPVYLQGLEPKLLGLAREVGDLVSAGSDDAR